MSHRISEGTLTAMLERPNTVQVPIKVFRLAPELSHPALRLLLALVEFTYAHDSTGYIHRSELNWVAKLSPVTREQAVSELSVRGLCGWSEDGERLALTVDEVRA